MDEKESALILTYLHLIGIFLLILLEPEIHRSDLSSIAVCIAALLGGIYISFQLFRVEAKNFPAYLLIFFASLNISLMFFKPISDSPHMIFMFMMSNIICFLQNSYAASQAGSRTGDGRIRSLWFLSLCLYLAIPGIGVGVPVWLILFYIARSAAKVHIDPFWLYVSMGWIVAIFITSLAMVKNIDNNFDRQSSFFAYGVSRFISLKNNIILSFCFAMIIIWLLALIPIASPFTRVVFK